MILLAILTGVFVVASRTINAKLSNIIGIVQGTFFNYIVGLAFSIVFLLFSSEKVNIDYLRIGSVPWWAFLGGVVGVIVVMLSSYITPKISALYLTILIFIAQLIVGVMIDYFTISIFSPGKLIGGLFVFAGLTYNVFIDSKDNKDSLEESI